MKDICFDEGPTKVYFKLIQLGLGYPFGKTTWYFKRNLVDERLKTFPVRVEVFDETVYCEVVPYIGY
jgi:hypothetical protein